MLLSSSKASIRLWRSLFLYLALQHPLQHILALFSHYTTKIKPYQQALFLFLFPPFSVSCHCLLLFFWFSLSTAAAVLQRFFLAHKITPATALFLRSTFLHRRCELLHPLPSSSVACVHHPLHAGGPRYCESL